MYGHQGYDTESTLEARLKLMKSGVYRLQRQNNDLRVAKKKAV